MTNLTTTQLQRLLDQATPGPWVRAWDNQHVLFNPDTDTVVHVEFYDDARNTELIAAAPDLAQEVLRLRTGVEQLLEMCLRERDAAFQDTPVRAGAVVAFGVCAEKLTNLLEEEDHDG